MKDNTENNKYNPLLDLIEKYQTPKGNSVIVYLMKEYDK